MHTPSPSQGTAGPRPMSPGLSLMARFRESSGGSSCSTEARGTGKVRLSSLPAQTRPLHPVGPDTHRLSASCQTACQVVRLSPGSCLSCDSTSTRLVNQQAPSPQRALSMLPGDGSPRPPTWPGVGRTGWASKYDLSPSTLCSPTQARVGAVGVRGGSSEEVPES